MDSPNKSSVSSMPGIIFAVVLFGAFFFVPVTEREPENIGPAIDSVVASHDELYELQSCVLYCAAHDDDGDSLSFTWSATDGAITADGEAATWTAPQRQGSYGIMVEIADGRGATDSSVVLVTVGRNQSPVVNAVTCTTPLMLQGQNAIVTCDAFDPDGHAVEFEWSCTAGSISGSGSTVEWTAPPASGKYPVSVRVSDEMAATYTSSTLIQVVRADPPVIDNMIGRPFLPEYSKEFAWGFRLLKGRDCECEIECKASSGENELDYAWSCDEGTIEGSGPIVLFTPPNNRADVLVTVVVSDMFGHSATDEIFFKVFTREAYSTHVDEIPGGCQCH